MAVDFCVVSIGALSHNRLWGEGAPVRTAHATTTLVWEDGRTILVDPSLPAVALAARFNERTGKVLSAVTDVFCTTLRPVHRRSVAAMPQAKCWCSEVELEAYSDHLKELLDSADRLGAEDVQAIKQELKLLERFEPAPEQFTRQVQLYPLAGPSVGSAGLLLTPATATIVIAGDAALTAEHVRRGQVWEGCADTQKALQSLQDLLELADLIVPGHDNVMLSTQRQWF
jgi:glyoxylase-like metal-dependent hydrolase (beta-lactamase superfamily II)